MSIYNLDVFVLDETMLCGDHNLPGIIMLIGFLWLVLGV